MATKETSISSSVLGGTITERVGKKRTTYQARFKRDGEQANETFKTKQEAIIFLAENARKLEKNEPVTSSSIKRLTLGKIFDDYIKGNEEFKELNEKGKPVKQKYINLCLRLKAEIGNGLLSKFNASSLEKYINIKRNQYIRVPDKNKKSHKNFNAERITIDGKEYYNKKMSEGSVRKIYYEIKKAIRWHAKVNNYFFDVGIFASVPAPGAWDNQRDRRLEEGEYKKLMDGCDGFYVNKEQSKLLINFLLLSCFRVGETFKIRWKDFYDGEKGREKDASSSYIFIPKENQKGWKKKAIKDRKAVMRPELYKLITEELVKYKKSDDDLMFPFWKSGAGYFYTRFKALCVRMKLEDLTIHDLRHEAISTLYELYGGRMTDIQIASITGHIELDTLKRYASLRVSPLGKVLWS